MSKEQRLELYKIVAIMLLVPIVCGIIFSNFSFAVQLTNPEVVYSSIHPTDSYTDNVSYGYLTSYNYFFNVYKSSDYEEPVYFFAYHLDNEPDNVYNLCLVLDPDITYPSGTIVWVYYGNRLGSGPTYSNFDLNSTYNLRTYNITNNTTLNNVYCPVYSSLNDGLSAIRDYINNSGSSETSPFYDDLPDFNIQRGYAAYIDFGADWQGRSISGQLISEFPQYSSLVSGDWDGTDNRRYAWVSELPSNTNFASNYGSAIDWTKVEPFDLLKRSKRGIWFIQSSTPQNRYLVIVNPNMWRYGQNASDDTLNRPITVHNLSGSAGEVKFYALNQTFDNDGTLVNYGSEDGTNNINGVYDPDTGSFNETNLNGNIATQTPGGNSDTPSINSVSDYIAQIGTILSNFANNLLSLIQKPISHIGTLIQGGSEFMSALRGLYSWLPVDIQAIIISALTVVIAIGVFKVFL